MPVNKQENYTFNLKFVEFHVRIRMNVISTSDVRKIFWWEPKPQNILRKYLPGSQKIIFNLSPSLSDFQFPFCLFIDFWLKTVVPKYWYFPSHYAGKVNPFTRPKSQLPYFFNIKFYKILPNSVRRSDISCIHCFHCWYFTVKTRKFTKTHKRISPLHSNVYGFLLVLIGLTPSQQHLW